MNREVSKIFPKRQIGFIQETPPLRMEEAVGPGSSQEETGPKPPLSELSDEDKMRFIQWLLEERRTILASSEKLTVKQKLKLLEENRQFLAVANGGSPFKFGTEKVIYGILIFSALVIIVLACLNVFSPTPLPTEVTSTFVGTVVGGTIATIAQKLGRVGR
jgi:hypothetical protein